MQANIANINAAADPSASVHLSPWIDERFLLLSDSE